MRFSSAPSWSGITTNHSCLAAIVGVENLRIERAGSRRGQVLELTVIKVEGVVFKAWECRKLQRMVEKASMDVALNIVHKVVLGQWRGYVRQTE